MRRWGAIALGAGLLGLVGPALLAWWAAEMYTIGMSVQNRDLVWIWTGASVILVLVGAGLLIRTRRP